MEHFTVDIKQTNTPTIVKFETNHFLTDHQSFEFNNIDEASDSPLAQQLFYLPFVKKVYISVNFIAIERFNIVEWEDVQDAVAKQIEDYLNNDGVVVTDTNKEKKVPVTVYAESTPNPGVLKFVSNKKLVDESFEFTSIDDTQNSPLAAKLFHFPFVKSVFIDYNYVSITKYDVAQWDDITMELREFIRNYIEQGNTVVSTAIETKSKTNTTEPVAGHSDVTSLEIIKILEEYVKPAVASDGGNIVFHSYDPDSKNVKLILQGACSGCPSSTITLKNGIETMLKEMLNGKVNSVEAING